MHPPNPIVVQVDTREKRPLLFPKTVKLWFREKPKILTVETEKTKLDAGDYRLKDFPNLCVVERKGSIRELYKNFFNTTDSRRQASAFGRLSKDSRYPYLLVQAATSELLSQSKHVPEPEHLLQRLTATLANYGLHMLVVPRTNTSASRRITGTVALHLMLGHAGFR